MSAEATAPGAPDTPDRPDAPAAGTPPDAAPDTAPPEPVLARGAAFEGTLVLPGPARIEGRMRGTVLAGGPVWVGEMGVVEADLEADELWIDGRVEGSLRARSRIALGPRAVVCGDLEAPRLAMAEGSQVNGRCRCGEAPPAP